MWILSLIMKFSVLYSQDEPITGIPNQTESPFTVPAGFLQIEAGVLVESFSRSYLLPVYPEQISHVTERNSYPSVFLRTGITDNFELRVGGGMSKLSGSHLILDPIVAGFKLKLTNEKKFLPNTAFLFHLSLPFRKEHSDYVSPNFLLAFSHTLTDHISIEYNLGTEWEINRGSVKGRLIYTFSGGFDFTDRISAFAEILGYMNQSEYSENLIDVGFGFLILKNLQADAFLGASLSTGTPGWFGGLGVYLKFPVWSKKK